MAAVASPQILDAACQLFAQQGVHRVTTAQVGQAAHTSTGALFRYFPTKDALLGAATMYAQQHLCQDIGPGPAFPRDTVYDSIRRVWEAAASHALAAPHLFAYWVLAGVTPGLAPPGSRWPRLPVFRGVAQLLAQVLPPAGPAGALLAQLLEAQWVATVQYVLEHPAGEQLRAPEVAVLLRQGYASWWAGVGLAVDRPFPPNRA